MTAGEQKRDFIHIDDVVSIYQLLLKKVQKESSFYQEYPIGSGKATTVRELVEIIHKLTKSKTILNFGALPYREGEIMFSEAKIEKLKLIGMKQTNSLTNKLLETIEEFKFSDCS